MYLIILRIIYYELQILWSLYNNEIIKYKKNFNLADYFKNLLFPKRKKKSIIFFRILFLIFVFRIFFDMYIVVFNFYYITIDWFFKNLKFFVKLYTENFFWIYFYDSLFDFLRYVFLFMPIVNLRKKLNRKKIKFRTYVAGIIFDLFSKFLLWRPNYWLILAPPFFILLFFFMAFTLFVFFMVDFIFLPFIDFLEVLWLYFLDFVLYLRILNYVRKYNKISSVQYLRKGSSLFHIALMMRNGGFEAPKSSEIEKLKAKAEYRIYRRSYFQSDMTPDYLDDKALDIYIFLLELFKDTRYELRRIPIKEFFFIIFPFAIIRHITVLLYYLYVVFAYFLLFLIIPFIILSVFLGISHDYFKTWEWTYLLFFKDLGYLEKKKAKIWDRIRRDAYREEKKLLRKAAFRSKLNKIYAIFKKFFK